jgi:hypothetical protein
MVLAERVLLSSPPVSELASRPVSRRPSVQALLKALALALLHSLLERAWLGPLVQALREQALVLASQHSS